MPRTDRREAERAEGFLVLDLAGTIEDACPGTEELLGREQGTLCGRSLASLFDCPELEAALGELGARRDGSFDGVRRVRGVLAGEPRSVPLSLGEARTADGDARLVAMVGEGCAAAGAPPPFAYVEEIRPGGRARNRLSGCAMVRYLGTPLADGADPIATWRSAVHVDDVVRQSRQLAASAHGHEDVTVYRIVDADGVTRWVRDVVRPRREADGLQLVFGLVRGLADGEPTVEAADGDEQLRAVVESIEDVLVYRVELRPDGGVAPVYVSPAAAGLLGGEPPQGEDLLDVWLAAIHPDDRDAHLAHLARLEQGEPDDAEFRVVGLDGRTRWIWSRARARRLPGDRLVLEGVMSDVTRRRAGPAEDRPAPALTRRQLEILRLLAEGRRTDDMAVVLGVTPVTVRNHVAGVLRALGAHSRLEAVARGRRLGLL